LPVPSEILIAEPPFSIRQFLRRKRVPLLVSISAHIVFVGALVYSRPLHVAPLTLAGDEHGTRYVLAYLPGHAKAPTGALVPRKVPKAAKAAPQIPALPAPEAAKISAPNTSSPVSATPDSSSGSDSLGSGDISIAVLKASPRPRPDLSQLPRGSAGDVVLDALIGPDGSIEKLTLVRGLGHGIDEVVIATVQAWTFLPATKDGKPIASEQELHFHYERG
jgi:periplasmic protein TonB